MYQMIQWLHLNIVVQVDIYNKYYIFFKTIIKTQFLKINMRYFLNGPGRP